jgi:hypothetical protein
MNNFGGKRQSRRSEANITAITRGSAGLYFLPTTDPTQV